MQIVIDIDEREWMDEKSIREVAFEYKKGSGFDRAIREGLRQAIVLPKGHGRLIDADDIALIDEQFYITSDYYVAESAINDTPTIIEAYKAERSDKE